VNSVRCRAIQFWRSLSLPYPEAGIRLIKQDDISLIVTQMASLQVELVEAVEQLDAHFGELKAAARNRLGQLYSSSDYPARLTGLFAMTWDFPSVEPPPYLQQLSPELYRQECERMQSRFNEAVRLAEAAFLEELNGLVSHLTERLAGQEDGKPKVFRDSAVENLTEFFQRFRNLNIGSNQQLDDLVDQAQQIVRGIQPQQLRDNDTIRREVATQLSSVQSVLDGLLVDRPRRAILRRPR
jgi:hypothetical protein